jgi:hypothetical protein
MRTVRCVVVLVSILCPAIVSAQSSLAGAVRDSSGAVLPGVTVEASSPALIEKVRSVATDTAGQYKIVDLRPGIYTITFSLTGFSVVKREGIELTGGGTVTVNADTKVGTLQETVTVTGETPVVDVQNAARQEILSGDLAANTPAAKSWNGLMLLMPGITGDPNTVQLTPSMVLFGIHGGATTEGRLQVDGMNVGASRGGGGVSGYSIDTANVQEVTFRTSGGLGGSGNRRAVDELRAEDRRQHLQGIVVDLPPDIVLLGQFYQLSRRAPPPPGRPAMVIDAADGRQASSGNRLRRHRPLRLRRVLGRRRIRRPANRNRGRTPDGRRAGGAVEPRARP